jgi:hypothetical protein
MYADVVLGWQTLGWEFGVRRCKTVVDTCRQCIQHQDLAIANRGPGGQLSVARPPGRVRVAPQARKVKNHRVE